MARRPYNMRLDIELMDQLQQIADKKGRTRTNLVEQIIKKFVAEQVQEEEMKNGK